MKPNFALSLSFDGIQLLHRAAGGWRIVGKVDPQRDDLTEKLSELRETALALEPGGITTKLLIPNDQIKYMTVDSTGLSVEARTEAARAALQGATPYAVSDLVFDTCADGMKTHIAAVARQTLSEAEAFANTHRFNPVSSVAVPGEGEFIGEPYFGPTLGAPDLLEPGQEVEPDGIAVVITGSIEHKDAPTEEKSEPEEPEKQADTQLAPKVEAVPDVQTKTEPELKTEANPPKDPQEIQADLQTAATASFRRSKTPVVEEPARDIGTNAPSVQIPDDDVPPAPALGGFSTRRAASAPTDTPPASSSSAIPSAPPPIAAAVADVQPLPPEAIPAKRDLLGRKIPAVAVAETPTKRAAGLTPGRTVIPAGASEAEKMTVFGARSDAVGGKPKYLGLMLCAALLVFLVGVAAWASVFMDDGLNLSRLFGERSARVSASSSVPTETSDGQILPNAMPKPATPATPAPETIQTASLEAGLSDEDSAVLDALRTPVVPEDLPKTREEIESNYAVTGIWPVAPDVPVSRAPLIELDNLYLSSIAPDSSQKDAVALPLIPDFTRANPLADTPLPPVPGQRFNLDARGLPVPSAEGAPSPAGYTVFLGKPPLFPPEAVLGRVVPDVVETPTAPTDAALPNPLADLRPKSRPGNLAERVERALLGGLTRSELADFRPTQRPASIQQQAEAARLAAEAAAAAESAAAAAQATSEATAAAVAQALASEAAEATADPFASATQQASAQSLRPDTRPRNFARIVARAAKSAPAAEVQEETRVASVAPRSVSPKIPTKSSVARSATVKNAINLRRVNLIGVYGKPSSRRALIRLSNGRYRKVEVGDRLDGGRVSAIGDSELRYTKGGRNVVLKMPRG